MSGPGEHDIATAQLYRSMAEHELAEVSPSYAALCRGVAGDAEVLARLNSLPAPTRQPNLLLAAVRHLGGPVASWPAFRSFTLDNWPTVAATMRGHRTQTNEAGRCATLLPVLAALPQPLALLEVGASAGLCLQPDRYAYRYDTAAGTHSVGSGPATLHCAVTGAAPLPGRLPTVVWRAGIDLAPRTVHSDADVRWLECLVWPEQTRRLDVLHAAVSIARADPPPVIAGDLTRDVLALAGTAPRDATLVVFHSAVLGYVPPEGRAAFTAQLDELSAARRVCWIANEAPGVLAGTEHLRTDVARFVLSVDGAPVARTDPHGTALEWLAPVSWAA